MKNFAKIFYGSEHDFLAKKIFDEDEKKYGIRLSTETENTEVALTMLQEHEYGRDQVWSELIKLPIESIEKLMSDSLEHSRSIEEKLSDCIED